MHTLLDKVNNLRIVSWVYLGASTTWTSQENLQGHMSESVKQAVFDVEERKHLQAPFGCKISHPVDKTYCGCFYSQSHSFCQYP